MKPTPTMRKALRRLIAGESQDLIGIPTRQRLVKYGFATWRPDATAASLLESVLNGRKLDLTDAGRKAVTP